MKNKMIKISTKVMSAMIAVSIVISSTTIPTYAAELPTEVHETAIETVVEAPEVEGQGDIIDDEFAYVEGQGDVIDDEFAYVEGQGDVIDDCFAVAPEAEVQPATETEVEGQGDVIDDCFAVDPEAEVQPVTGTEVEGQGDVIDDQFAVSEEEAWKAANEIRTAEMAKYFGEFGTVEMDLHNAEWYQEYQKAQEAKKAEEERAKQLEEIVAEVNAAMKPGVDAMIKARLNEETKVETKEETKVVQTKKGPKKVVAPAIHMDFSNTLFGYSGKEVDYKNLEVGKFYLMQIPKTKYFPNFSYRVVKILGSYTDEGIFFDDVMVKYNQYHWDGTLDVKNKKTQVNENLLTNLASKVPNHFFEITDDILVK